MKKIFIALFLVLSMTISAQTPAFPTAEGYGMWATGGRGGQVVEVTTLEDDASNPIEGSLRWAMKQYSKQPITIVFRVSGIIDLNGNNLRITRNDMTIAGQTAPGDGICIKGGCVNLGGSRNLIIRHIRSRVGVLNDTEYNPTQAPSSEDFIAGASLNIENGGNFIVDHCSFSWSAEENVGFYDNDNTTVQWCIFSEGLYDAGHGKGARSYGAVLGGKTATYHHNLLAHNYNRSPRFGATTKNDVVMLLDYVNNVNYNFGKKNSCYGGDNRQGDAGLFQLNYVNNYCKPGPAYAGDRQVVFIGASFCNPDQGSQGKSYGKWHLSGNYMEGSYASSVGMNTDNYKGFDIDAYTEAVPGLTLANMKSDHIKVAYPVKTETAAEAYESVLKNVGAFPRDSTDRRVLNEVATGKASGSGTFNNYRVCGIINKPSDSGGYSEYETYNQITDADHDGMDDAWEVAKGFNPANANDRNYILKSGYTLLEAYLCSLVGENIPVERANPYDITVAQDGSGDYTTIQEAIDAAPENSTRTKIFVRNGTYEEKVFIGNRWQGSKKIISLIGENVDSVVIVWDDYHGKTISYPGKDGTISADGMTAATLTVTAPDFYMENITVKNTIPSTTSQAEALYQAGDRQILKNCKILGYQDTHRTKKGNRFFYYKCTIEGNVDFIYAGGTCYFYQCNIVSNGKGYITAPEDIAYKTTLTTGKTLYYGFIFNDCDLLAKETVADGIVYLGRPWQNESGSVFMNCRLGKHINTAGWSGDLSNVSFAEYKNMNEDGSALIDVSKRISGSIQLSENDRYDKLGLRSIYNAVSSSSFEPAASVLGVSAPSTVTVSGKSLSWTAVSGAIGYIIYANNEILDYAETNAYYDLNDYADKVTYQVRAVAENGSMSNFNGVRNPLTVAILDSTLNPDHRVKLTTGVLPANSGTVTCSPIYSSSLYLVRSSVTFTATRQYGYKFLHWIDSDSTILSTEPTFSYTVSEAEKITAVFEKLPLYTLTCLSENIEEDMIIKTPNDTLIGDKRYYEAGTSVTLMPKEHPMYNFICWEDQSTDNPRVVKMDSDIVVKATFYKIPYILAWTFQSKGTEYYTADLYSDPSNTGEMNMRDEDWNYLPWQDRSAGFLGRSAALNGQTMDKKYYFEAELKTKGYTDILVKSAMAIDANGYSVQKLEYSTDMGATFSEAGTITIPSVQTWQESAIYLPEEVGNKDLVYLRWIPDYTSSLYGSETGMDGTAITDIYVLIQKKDAMPASVSSVGDIKYWQSGECLYVQTTDRVPTFIKLHDLTGRCVAQFSEVVDSYDISNISKGVYLLSVGDSKGVFSVARFLKR